MKSQSGNLKTKKERQSSRFKLYHMFGKKTPFFDGGYNKKNVNILLELKVYLIQKILYLFEKIKLYTMIAKLLGRIK